MPLVISPNVSYLSCQNVHHQTFNLKLLADWNVLIIDCCVMGMTVLMKMSAVSYLPCCKAPTHEKISAAEDKHFYLVLYNNVSLSKYHYAMKGCFHSSLSQNDSHFIYSANMQKASHSSSSMQRFS